MMSALVLVALLLVNLSDNGFLKNNHVSAAARDEFKYTLDEGYPVGNKTFGDIAGVDVDKDNNIIIFHRGSHHWLLYTFDEDNVYQPSKTKPIPEDTVITIEPKGKRITHAWGKDRFYLPHGLSLDSKGEHLWLTDVALHQVFKYTLDGSQELMVLGSAFVPGNDEKHFCKPTSVADTADFVFVADGYCNSRIAVFSPKGVYLTQFGQSMDAMYPNRQPRFNIPHKIIYAKEAKMLCVADRENGRFQCFSYNPKHNQDDQDNSLILNGAIEPKFTIADPAFNGLLFSLDYSPIRGGIIVAVSGAERSPPYRPALGFVYNVTNRQLISKFSPPSGQVFGMAHDLAITGEQADSLYVVDITPVNLWKFSRHIERHKGYRDVDLTGMASNRMDRAISAVSQGNAYGHSYLWYMVVLFIIMAMALIMTKFKRLVRHSTTYNMATPYSSTYPSSVNSLFGQSKLTRRPHGIKSRTFLSGMFTRGAFVNLLDRAPKQAAEFSRLPLEESNHNSEDDKSDSDVEEFNINHASNPNVKIDV